MAKRSSNPSAGEHPDLFEGSSRVYVPLEDLTEDEIKALPRDAFSDEEWDELDDDVQEWIHENDPESKTRIQEIVDAFVGEYEFRTSDEQLLSDAYEYFESWLGENAYGNGLVNIARRRFPDEIEEIEARWEGYDVDDLTTALSDALATNNNYEESIEDEYGSHGDAMYAENLRVQLYFDDGNSNIDLDAIHDDELVAAFSLINEHTDDAWDPLRVEDFRSRPGRRWIYPIERSVDTGKVFVAVPKWDDIAADVDAEMELHEGPEDVSLPEIKLPPEERIVYRFDDGFYVVDLEPQELAAEGKAMRMCVGQPRWGYGKAVQAGRIKIYSLRPPAGVEGCGRARCQITFEVRLDRSGEPAAVAQAKGKFNRRPGFESGGERGDIVYPDEVQRVIEFVRHLGLEPNEVADLRPAYEHPSSVEWFRGNPSGEEYSFDLPQGTPVS